MMQYDAIYIYICIYIYIYTCRLSLWLWTLDKSVPCARSRSTEETFEGGLRRRRRCATRQWTAPLVTDQNDGTERRIKTWKVGWYWHVFYEWEDKSLENIRDNWQNMSTTWVTPGSGRSRFGPRTSLGKMAKLWEMPRGLFCQTGEA